MRLACLVVVLAIVAMSVPSLSFCGSDGTSTLCANPIKETIENTASINEMRSKPACGMCSKIDALGNKVPTQTENCGKTCLGN